MKLFYEEYEKDLNLQQAVANLPWGHNLLLIEKINDKNIRKFYAESSIQNGWSRNVLAMQIESEFHKRVRSSTNNFLTILPKYDSDLANNTIKDVLIKLGKGFSFVENQ